MTTFGSHIENVLSRSLAGLRSYVLNAGKCCDLKGLDFSGGNAPDYDNHGIQLLYLLRYYGAYLCEYRKIYAEVLEFLDQDRIRVLSLGSGCCVDLAGLYFELEEHGLGPDRVQYRGYDSVNWHWRFEAQDLDTRVIHRNVARMSRKERPINVMIFPKSLGDFSGADHRELVAAIRDCEFSASKVVVVSSARAVDPSLDRDVRRFAEIVGEFRSKGYETGDDPMVYTHYPYAPAWARLFPGFSIPDEVVAYLKGLALHCPVRRQNGVPCKMDCDALSRYPILKSGQVRYQVVRLTR